MTVKVTHAEVSDWKYARVQGQTAKEIAIRSGRSENTVCRHTDGIIDKIDRIAWKVASWWEGFESKYPFDIEAEDEIEELETNLSDMQKIEKEFINNYIAVGSCRHDRKYLLKTLKGEIGASFSEKPNRESGESPWQAWMGLLVADHICTEKGEDLSLDDATICALTTTMRLQDMDGFDKNGYDFLNKHVFKIEMEYNADEDKYSYDTNKLLNTYRFVANTAADNLYDEFMTLKPPRKIQSLIKGSRREDNYYRQVYYLAYLATLCEYTNCLAEDAMKTIDKDQDSEKTVQKSIDIATNGLFNTTSKRNVPPHFEKRILNFAKKGRNLALKNLATGKVEVNHFLKNK